MRPQGLRLYTSVFVFRAIRLAVAPTVAWAFLWKGIRIRTWAPRGSINKQQIAPSKPSSKLSHGHKSQPSV